MAIRRSDLDGELVGRRAYLAGFHEAMRRARERAAWVLDHDTRAATAAEVAPFVDVQLSVWVAQYGAGVQIGAKERAYRHGYGDVCRALSGRVARAKDALAQLESYRVSEVLPWVDARPTNAFELRLMPRRFEPDVRPT